MKRLTSLFLVLMFACTWIPVLAEGDNVLRIALEQDIVTFDSQQNTSAYTYAIMEGIEEALLREHNGEFMPGLADSWSTDDYITWTFHIRDEACWSDGTPITAEDISWSYHEIFTRPESAKVYICYSGVQGYNEIMDAMEAGVTGDELRQVIQKELGVTALDERTLQVVLSSTRPWEIDSFASPAWSPIRRDLYEANGTDYGSSLDKVAMCGPFIATEWRYNEMVTLEPNPNYWNRDAVKVDKVEFHIVKDVEPRVNMFREGKLDYAVASNDYLISMPDDVNVVSGTAWYFTMLNAYRRDADGNLVNEKLSALLANDNFSAAVNYALNRTSLFGSVIENPAFLPTQYSIPAGINSNNTARQTIGELRGDRYNDVAPLTRDADKAVEYLNLALSEVGYASAAEVPEIKICCANTADLQTITEYQVNALSALLGLNLSMDAMEFGVRDSRVISGDYDMMFFGWNNSTNDASDYLNPFVTDLFMTGWPEADPEHYAQYAALVSEIESTTDMDHRADLILQAEEILMRNGQVINLANAGNAQLMSKRFNDFLVRPMGSKIDYVFANLK